MHREETHVLLVEDNPGDARLVREALRDADALDNSRGVHRLTVAQRLTEAFQAIDVGDVDVVLLDLGLPDSTGLETFTRCQDYAGGCPIVVLTRQMDDGIGAQALRAGAQDYLPKSQLDSALLTRTLYYARERKQLELDRLMLARTEAARAEAVAQRARMRETFEQAPVPLSVLRAADQVFEVANPLYERLVGRTNLVGRSFREAFPELAADAPVFKMVDTVIATGETFAADEYPVRIDRHGDGRLEDVFFLFTCKPVRDDTGAVATVITVAIDVTAQVIARKHVEHARRLAEANEAQFRGVAETMPQIVWRTRPDGWVEYFNSRWHAFTGASREQSEGAGWLLFIHPSDRDGARDRWARAVADGGLYEIEYRIRRHDDVYRWFLGRALPMRDAAGAIVMWFGTCTDIDDQKRAETSLRVLAEAGDVLSSPFDATATMQRIANQLVPALADYCTIFLRDGDTTKLMALAHADPEKLPILRQSLLQYPLPDDVPHGYPAVIRTGASALFTDVAPALDTIARDREHRTLLRELAPLSSIVVPLTVSGRTFGALTLSTAESGRRYTSDDLRLAEEIGRRVALALDSARLFELTQQERRRAEEANRVKDEFLGVASHELRTPLNAILGWSRMLRSNSLDDAKRERALEVIERNANVQVQLVDDILDVSRIITGKLRLDVTALEVGPIAEAAADVVRPAADAKGVRLQLLLDRRAGLIHGDSGRLQQIIWNLLANAVKFTPKGGRVHLRLAREDSHIEIAVTDSGQGIERRFLPHVFEPFRQADGSSTRSHGGLGLGLAIVKHLVELHGGSIEA
ncbi:MAG: PAS domain-containing protein, partial [Myxococcales bacterium]|nr:PAS domain-containing protein [Myxococcales bacterium]